MEILSPTGPYLPCSGLFTQACSSSSRRGSGGFWTHEENKRFEDALAEFDEETPGRWEKVASVIPGKTAEDVRRHYQDLEADVCHIEAGLIPPPGYSTSSPHFTFDWVKSDSFKDGWLKQSYQFAVVGKRSGGKPCDHIRRKKGIPWTEDEHKRFLMGLKTYGKGDWRNISHKLVISRTPTQVASHAQKYFLRLSSSGKDKRRPSIHDITTVDVSDSPPGGPLQPSSAVSHCYSSSSSSSSSSSVSPHTLPSEMYNPSSWALTSPSLFFRTPYEDSAFGVQL